MCAHEAHRPLRRMSNAKLYMLTPWSRQSWMRGVAVYTVAVAISVLLLSKTDIWRS